MQIRIYISFSTLLHLLLLTCLISHTKCQLVNVDIPPEVFATEILHNKGIPTTNCEIACGIVADLLPGSVFIGQTGNFDFWDTKQKELIPTCRVEPATTEDITTILRTAITHKCHFAVKSGGHERAPGASNAKDGITIDLIKLTQLDFSPDKSTITLGPGHRWEDIYAFLEPHNLIVLGGRIGDVGVAGLLLGGGISYYSNTHGLACDSIERYTMILPNLTHATITPDNPLHRALRGTGHMNYGIITSFTLRTYPATHQLWTAVKSFPWHNTAAVLAANHRTASAMAHDPGIAAMFMYTCYPLYSICLATLLAQHTTHTDTSWPESMAEYHSVEGLERSERVSMKTLTSIVKDMDAATDGSRHRTIYATFSYVPSVALESELLKIFREECERPGLSEVVGFTPGMVMHPVSARMVAAMANYRGNAFRNAVPEPITVLNIAMQWDDRDDDERVYRVYREMMARLEAKAKEMGLWRAFKYVNYAEPEQYVWEGYGGEIEVYRKLQREVDPDGVFAEGGLAGGVFKVSRRREQRVKDEL